MYSYGYVDFFYKWLLNKKSNGGIAKHGEIDYEAVVKLAEVSAVGLGGFYQQLAHVWCICNSCVGI